MRPHSPAVPNSIRCLGGGDVQESTGDPPNGERTSCVSPTHWCFHYPTEIECRPWWPHSGQGHTVRDVPTLIGGADLGAPDRNAASSGQGSPRKRGSERLPLSPQEYSKYMQSTNKYRWRSSEKRRTGPGHVAIGVAIVLQLQAVSLSHSRGVPSPIILAYVIRGINPAMWLNGSADPSSPPW
jgi:hypothetical protein